jgi:GntR family transcriptional repressor for pyruvate dehydrogenase complex
MTKQPPFQAIERATIYVQVAEQIRDAILARTISSGERLPPERELALQFGVSRATVREALRHLQAQGLLAARGRTSPMHANPHGPIERFREALTNVVKLRDVSLTDLIELRIAIESTALARACVTPIAEHLEEARRQLTIMQDPKITIEVFHHADVAFHVALVAASGNEALHLVMLAVRDGIELHLDDALRARSFPKARARLVAEHEALFTAIERGNARQLTKLLGAHLAGFYGT